MPVGVALDQLAHGGFAVGFVNTKDLGVVGGGSQGFENAGCLFVPAAPSGGLPGRGVRFFQGVFDVAAPHDVFGHLADFLKVTADGIAKGEMGGWGGG